MHAYKIYLTLIIICFGNIGTILFAQERDEYFELNELTTGTKEYIARDYITLQDGFIYSAATRQT